MNDIEDIFGIAGIKSTPNRIVVLRELMESTQPLSLGELDDRIGTLEKSSILRTLAVLRKNHLIHDIEDGRGVVKYECCTGYDGGKDTDMHVHFYCDVCQNITCFEGIPIPHIPMPDGYRMETVNYMIKGVCPDCKDAKGDDSEA